MIANLSTDTLAAIASFILIALQVAMILVWRKKTGAMWIMLLLASVAYAAVNLPSGLLRSALESFLELVITGPVTWRHALFSFWVFMWTAEALHKEGVKWIIFRFIPPHMLNWRNGVMFGLGYSALLAASLVTRHYIAEGVFPIFSFFTLWHWGIVQAIYNVGTTLAVIYSAKRRKAPLFVIAVVLSVAYYAISRAIFMYFSGPPFSDLKFNLGSTVSVIPVALLIVFLYFAVKENGESQSF